MVTRMYKAVDCFVVSHAGDRITFKETQSATDTYDVDLADQTVVDINKWQSPRGFTSVGDDGRGGFVTTGAVWVTQAWIDDQTGLTTVDQDNQVGYYDEATDRRYMGFVVDVQNNWNGSNFTFTYDGGPSATADLDDLTEVDAGPGVGLTELERDDVGRFLVYFSPGFIDGTTALADPKKPPGLGRASQALRADEYLPLRATVTDMRPSGRVRFVVRDADVGKPALTYDIDLLDPRHADAPVWAAAEPGYTEVGRRDDGGADFVGEIWASLDWLADLDAGRRPPLPNTDERAVRYPDGRRYRRVAATVRSVQGDVLTFSYGAGQVGVVSLADRRLVDAHVGAGGRTTLSLASAPGSTGSLYLSPGWLTAQARR